MSLVNFKKIYKQHISCISLIIKMTIHFTVFTRACTRKNFSFLFIICYVYKYSGLSLSRNNHRQVQVTFAQISFSHGFELSHVCIVNETSRLSSVEKNAEKIMPADTHGESALKLQDPFTNLRSGESIYYKECAVRDEWWNIQNFYAK